MPTLIPLWDALWCNARLVTCDPSFPFSEHVLGAVAVKDGEIAWAGPMSELPDLPHTQAREIIDVEGRCITPGLIDCHTHLVYAGNRAQEFEMHLQGMTYREIAEAGGGILSTVAATRSADEASLFQQSYARLKRICSEGVTTLEIKSGYGLDDKTEYKILQVARRLGELLPLTVKTTFLGAHTVPPEYKGRTDAYVDFVCKNLIPEIAQTKLADAVDVFCDTIAFGLSHTEQIFQCAQQHGLAVKIHAEQLSSLGAAALAARYHALSADHLEFLDEIGIEALAKAGTAAVLLPSSFYFLRENRLPPVAALRRAGVPIAIATDCNPGTSPNTSLLLSMNMACVLFQLTPFEALAGVTIHAARALGLEAHCGSLTKGKWADFVVWDVAHPRELAYHMGWNPCHQVIKRGQPVQWYLDQEASLLCSA